MTRPLQFVLRAAAIVVCLAVPAGEPARAEPDLDAVVEAHIEALGGYDRIKSIRTLVYSSGVYREGEFTGSGDAFMAFMRPYFRVVGNPESPGGYMEGYDGAAWEWLGNPGIVVRTVGHAAGATRRGADFEGRLVDWREKGSTVTLHPDGPDGAGIVEFDERPTYRLTVTTRDGFSRDYFLDRGSFLIVAERYTAPFHAFGEPVVRETRIGDYRPVAGVLRAHRYVATEIGTGRELSSMQWGRIEANRELPSTWFSPPVFTRTRLQRFLEHLYGERTDVEALLWSYAEFRRAWPEIDTRAGVETIGYQMLKMGEVAQAIALLEVNAEDHPESADSAFGVGRAYATAGDGARARIWLGKALALDPEHRRARKMLDSLD